MFLQGLHQSEWQTWLAGGRKRDVFRLLLLLGEILVKLICCITICANHEHHIQGFPWVCCVSVCQSVFCLFGSLSFYVHTKIIFVSRYKYTIILKRYCLPKPFNPFRVTVRVDVQVKAGCTSGWVASSSQGSMWDFVCSLPCSRAPKQCSEGVLAPFPTTGTYYMFCLHSLLLSPVPNTGLNHPKNMHDYYFTISLNKSFIYFYLLHHLQWTLNAMVVFWA